MKNAALNLFGGVYRGRRVLVTGHTGFKGAWLCEWLLQLGAEVTGLALPPPTEPSLFQQLALRGRMDHVVGDICDPALVNSVVQQTRPDFVFHLAAQSLVRASYVFPVQTYATNLLGSVHVMDAVRKLGHPCVIIMVTTDKCYENKEWVYGYREDDPLGGFDPYSSSKGAAELAVAAYRRSYFSEEGLPVRIASVRAGNVIGGGDWARDRIVPDCIRHLARGEAIPVRSPASTRPWQHVLEPLSGYLALAERIVEAPVVAAYKLTGAFNFGPGLNSNRTVGELVEEILKHWPGGWKDGSRSASPHEAKMLGLVTDKARYHLGWQPVWNFEEAVARTVQWYREAATIAGDEHMAAYTRAQIDEYLSAAVVAGAPWTTGCR